jgi:hypothetical protein
MYYNTILITHLELLSLSYLAGRPFLFKSVYTVGMCLWYISRQRQPYTFEKEKKRSASQSE